MSPRRLDSFVGTEVSTHICHSTEPMKAAGRGERDKALTCDLTGETRVLYMGHQRIRKLIIDLGGHKWK